MHRCALFIALLAILAPLPARATLCYTDGADRCYATIEECPKPRDVIRCPTVACESTPGCPTYQPKPSLSAPAAPASSSPPVRFQPVEAKLQIPTFKLSDLRVHDIGGGTTVVNIPWIGEYIAAIYRWAVPVGAILATVVIMVGGLIWLTSGGAGTLSTAKQVMGNAVIGLILLVGSYVVLNLINPDLVRFTQLQVRITQRIEALPEAEPVEVVGREPDRIVAAVGAGITGGSLIEASLLPDLSAVAVELRAGGYEVLVTSSFRNVERQQQLIAENCRNPPGSDACDPKPGRPTTCMLRRGPASCPHTTGRAIDAWGTRDGVQCVPQRTCVANRTACRANPCQSALIQAMRSRGFCVLASEPWHFEKPRMSANCT